MQQGVENGGNGDNHLAMMEYNDTFLLVQRRIRAHEGIDNDPIEVDAEHVINLNTYKEEFNRVLTSDTCRVTRQIKGPQSRSLQAVNRRRHKLTHMRLTNTGTGKSLLWELVEIKRGPAMVRQGKKLVHEDDCFTFVGKKIVLG